MCVVEGCLRSWSEVVERGDTQPMPFRSIHSEKDVGIILCNPSESVVLESSSNRMFTLAVSAGQLSPF